MRLPGLKRAERLVGANLFVEDRVVDRRCDDRRRQRRRQCIRACIPIEREKRGVVRGADAEDLCSACERVLTTLEN